MGYLTLKRVRQDKSNTNGARKHFHKPRKQGTQITSCLNLDSWCLESAFKTSLWWRSIRHNILSTTCVWSASDRHAVNKPHIYIFSRGFFFELCRIMGLNLPMLGISQSSFPFSFPKLISFWPESIFPVLQNRLSCGSVLCTPNSLVYQLCHMYLTKASGYRAADWDVLRPPNEATNQLLLCRACLSFKAFCDPTSFYFYFSVSNEKRILTSPTKIVKLFLLLFLQSLYHTTKGSFILWKVCKDCYIIPMAGYTILIILNFFLRIPDNICLGFYYKDNAFHPCFL